MHRHKQLCNHRIYKQLCHHRSKMDLPNHLYSEQVHTCTQQYRQSTYMYPVVYDRVHIRQSIYTTEYICVPGTYAYSVVYDQVHICTLSYTTGYMCKGALALIVWQIDPPPYDQCTERGAKSDRASDYTSYTCEKSARSLIIPWAMDDTTRQISPPVIVPGSSDAVAVFH